MLYANCKRVIMKIKQLIMRHKVEKDRKTADRMLLVILIMRDNMSITDAADYLNKSKAWGQYMVQALPLWGDKRTIHQATIWQKAKGPQMH